MWPYDKKGQVLVLRQSEKCEDRGSLTFLLDAIHLAWDASESDHTVCGRIQEPQRHLDPYKTEDQCETLAVS